jgi:tetratricopeptide (TPR) repeat protein
MISQTKEMSDSRKYEPHFHGSVQGVVIGDNNMVTLIFQTGERHTVPFLAPPRPPYDLVGRDDLLCDLKQRLFAGGSLGLSALNGLPGVGKTALAIALVHDREVLDHFRDGVLWAGLGREGDAFALLGSWAIALGISSDEIAKLTSLEERAKAIRAKIGMRHMFLVVDDAWQSESALAFKVGGPNCAHLVTTRLPEVAVHFAGEGVAVVHELSEADSLTLLARLAPEVIKAEPDTARELVQAVGGLPLGLILIGNYLRVQALSGQPRRIEAALEWLRQVEGRLRVSQPQSALESHPSLPPGASISLQAIIAISDEALDGIARRMLYTLSVFPPKPNTFSEEAAMAVATEPAEVLDTLTDFGLLEGSGPGRYTLHQTIANYAELKLTDKVAYERMTEFFKNYVQTRQNDYGAIEIEQNNIIAALQWAINSKHTEVAADIVIPFFKFLEGRGLYDWAYNTTQSVAEVARKTGISKRLPLLLRNLWLIERHRGNNIAKRPMLLEALTMAENLGDKRTQTLLNLSMGASCYDSGEYESAERHYRKGLALAREMGQRENIRDLLQNLGALSVRRGAYDQAEVYYQEGLALAREMGHRESISYLLQNLGALAERRKAYDQAETYYQEGLALAREIGHRERISALLTNLGVVAAYRGAYDQAEAYYQEGLALAREIGHREVVSFLLANLGSLAVRRREYDQATVYYRESLALAREMEHPWLTSGILIEWGQLYLKQQNWDLAAATFRESLEMAREVDMQEFVAKASYGLAKVAFAQGNIDDAWRQGQGSLAILEVMGHGDAAEVEEWLGSLPAEHSSK